MNQEIRNQNQEILKKLNLNVPPSRLPTPFVCDEPPGFPSREDRDSSPTQNMLSVFRDTTPPEFNQLYQELDGFSNILKREKNAVTLQLSSSESTSNQGSSSISSNPDDVDVTQLQKVQQEIDSVLERVRNQQKRIVNKSIQRNDTYDSGISGMSYAMTSGSPAHSTFSDNWNSHHSSPQWPSSPKNFGISTSPLLRRQPARPELTNRPPSTSTIARDMSPTLGSSPSFSNAETAQTTPALSPFLVGPRKNSQAGSAFPELQLPPAAQDWMLVCEDAEVYSFPLPI